MKRKKVIFQEAVDHGDVVDYYQNTRISSTSIRLNLFAWMMCTGWDVQRVKGRGMYEWLYNRSSLSRYGHYEQLLGDIGGVCKWDYEGMFPFGVDGFNNYNEIYPLLHRGFYNAIVHQTNLPEYVQEWRKKNRVDQRGTRILPVVSILESEWEKREYSGHYYYDWLSALRKMQTDFVGKKIVPPNPQHAHASTILEIRFYCRRHGWGVLMKYGHEDDNKMWGYRLSPQSMDVVESTATALGRLEELIVFDDVVV